jgi:hypothetical protein
MKLIAMEAAEEKPVRIGMNRKAFVEFLFAQV